MVGAALAMALQAAAWQPLPLTTAIPPMLFICTPAGEAAPTFNTPWWQLIIVRNATMNRVRLYQVGTGHVVDQARFNDGLTAYEVQREPTQTTWRMTYARGDDRLVVEFFTPASGRDNVRFSWRRPQGTMEGTCSPGPPAPDGWETREGVWQ